MIYKAF